MKGFDQLNITESATLRSTICVTTTYCHSNYSHIFVSFFFNAITFVNVNKYHRNVISKSLKQKHYQQRNISNQSSWHRWPERIYKVLRGSWASSGWRMVVMGGRLLWADVCHGRSVWLLFQTHPGLTSSVPALTPRDMWLFFPYTCDMTGI